VKRKLIENEWKSASVRRDDEARGPRPPLGSTAGRGLRHRNAPHHNEGTKSWDVSMCHLFLIVQPCDFAYRLSLVESALELWPACAILGDV
jgi:hypothetical protein